MHLSEVRVRYMYFISCGLYQLRPQQETWYIQSKLSCQRKTEKISPQPNKPNKSNKSNKPNKSSVSTPKFQPSASIHNLIFNANQLK